MSVLVEPIDHLPLIAAHEMPRLDVRNRLLLDKVAQVADVVIEPSRQLLVGQEGPTMTRSPGRSAARIGKTPVGGHQDLPIGGHRRLPAGGHPGRKRSAGAVLFRGGCARGLDLLVVARRCQDSAIRSDQLFGDA